MDKQKKVEGKGWQPLLEGGCFKRIYTAPHGDGQRPEKSIIEFCLLGQEISRLHSLDGEEEWLHEGGDPLEVVRISPRGGAEILLLQAGERVCFIRGEIFGARVLGDQGARLTCAMTPAYVDEGLHLWTYDELKGAFADLNEQILALTAGQKKRNHSKKRLTI